jgi:hypothetical protein
MSNLWKVSGAVIAAILCFSIGVGLLIKPSWLMEKERLLTPWNRFENRLVGLIFAGFALLVMYSIWHWGLFQTEASS